ncbi:MAG: POTRA domain-containing protein [Pseudomonadota bacterium]
MAATRSTFNQPRCAATLLLAAFAIQAGAAETDAPAAAPVIGEVVLAKQNIFDLTDEKENNWLYRLANRLHIVTHDGVIEQQLLFAPGDVFDPRRLEESERILRRNRYFFDASITPLPQDDGTVDVEVATKDVWSLTPDLSFTRNGGETRWGFGLEENNLLGWGSSVRVKRVEGIDRDSNRFEYRDTNLGRSWTQLRVRVADNSDGSQELLSVIRPFHALDARWTAGVSLLDDDRRTALWSLGDEAAVFRHERQFFNAFGGLSDGLQNGWVRRWTAGYIYDDNVFSERPEDALPPAVPSDRKLSYPYIGFELLEDNFETTSNTNRMGRTEDFFIGTRLAATLGWSDDAFGADRDALIFSTTFNQGYGSISKTALFLGAQVSGRHEDGQVANMLTGLSGRFFHRQSEKWLFSATVEGIVGDNLDLDTTVQLGGNNGLRGYPVRYQSGDSRMLFSVEQRYFTDWYPFRLLRVGGAIFADVGRTWGQNPVGEPNQGWLKDVGFGFRFAPTRFSTDKIVHLDFAFPQDAA